MSDIEFEQSNLKGSSQSQSGMSLIAVIVALGMAGILLATVSKTMFMSIKSSSKFEQDTERSMLRIQISQSIDCRSTLEGFGTAPLTNNGTNVDLKRADGTIFIPSAGRKVGKWFVRASIEANSVLGGSMLQVRVAKPRNTNGNNAFATPYDKSNYATDPLNNNSVLSWTHPKSGLIIPDSPICASFFHSGFYQDCGPGKKAVGFDQYEKVICADNATLTECPAGTKVNKVNTDGTVECTNVVKLGEDCATGQRVNGYDALGDPICITAAKINVGCSGNQIMKGIDLSGDPICVNIPTPTVSHSNCNWEQSLNCNNCGITCDGGKYATRVSTNFSGNGGNISGNLEVYCCNLTLSY